MDASGFFGEPLDEGGAVADLRSRFGKRLSLLQGHQHSEVVRGFEDQIVPAFEQSRPLPSGLAAPGAESTRGSGDRHLRFRAAAIGDTSEVFAVGGVLYRNRGASNGLDPAPADKAAAGDQRRIV